MDQNKILGNPCNNFIWWKRSFTKPIDFFKVAKSLTNKSKLPNDRNCGISHNSAAALLNERIDLFVDADEQGVMWSVLFCKLNHFLNRLWKTHSSDAALDAKTLNDWLLSSKIRWHSVPSWKKLKGSTGKSN